MKGIIFIFITLFCGFSGYDLQDANQCYHEQRYSEALMIYERLLEESPQSPELLYNAGNACYQMRLYGHAIWYYRKALINEPYDQDIQNHLRLAESSLAKPAPVLAPFSFKRWLRETLKIVPSFLIVTVLTIAWYALFIYIFIYLKSNRVKRKWLLRRMIFPAVFILTTALIYSGQWIFVKPFREAIILKSKCEVKQDPSVGSTVEFTIYEGWRTEIINNDRDWLLIRLDNGNEGWIKADDAGIVQYD